MKRQKHKHVYRASCGFFWFVKLINYFILTNPRTFQWKVLGSNVVCGHVCRCYTEKSITFRIMELVSGEKVQKLHNTE